MPELAAMYLAGSILSMIVGILFGLKQRAKYHRPHMIILQKNLNKIGFRWNELNMAVESRVDLPADIDDREYQKARFTSILFTIIAMIFSWLGSLFLVVIWISLNLLNRSRLEKALLASPLSSSELATDEVKNIFQELQKQT